MVQFLDMGQNSSLPKGRRKSLRSFKRHSITSDLSHTFHLNDYEERAELININLATEEELMTLPNVNREIAKNIVDHRKAIGRFRKVEDLALVRGIGATKLEKIKPEICVSTRMNQSGASSRAQSYDSLRSTESRNTTRSLKIVNINKATIFELQSLPGITQEISAAIIHHRNKKGPFKKIDDLLKVKQMDRVRLDSIYRYLTIESTETDSINEECRPSILTNGYTMPSLTNHNKSTNGPLNLSISNGLSLSSTIDIFELLSTYSRRPILEENFKYRRNGEPAIRVASWNLHEFSNDKSANLGVKEVICRTILENGWSILAVQDIYDVTALKSICEELNKPKLRRIKEWKDKNHNWNFCMLDIPNSKLGFIYDSNGALDIELQSLRKGPDETINDCEVLIANFTIGSISMQLVNMSLYLSANVETIKQKMTDLALDDDSIILFIDFSHYNTPVDEFLSLGNMKAVFSKNTNTCFVNSKDNLTKHKSNILANQRMRDQFLTGFNGVVRQGVTHLAIPSGWSWGGPVSPYCPIWTEMFLNSNADTAL